VIQRKLDVYSCLIILNRFESKVCETLRNKNGNTQPIEEKL